MILEKKKRGGGGGGGYPVAFGPTAVVRAPRTWGVYKPMQQYHWLLKKKRGVSEGIQLPLILLWL